MPTTLPVRFAEGLRTLFAMCGITPRVAQPSPQRGVIKVLGPAPDRDEVSVGVLTNEQGEFVFRYDPAYAARRDYPALVAFPEKHREYRSTVLWPFFDVRLPPLDRADIRHLIDEHKLHHADTLQLLGELGARTITTPYQLRYERVAA
jgi:HipA-like protein